MSTDTKTYNIIMVGDGKTNQYLPTRFLTNHGTFKLAIDECSEQNVFFSRDKKFYEKYHGAIVMFDVTSKISYNNAHIWMRNVTLAKDNIPIVVCGNKCDCKVPFESIRIHQHACYDNYNTEKPFLHLLRQITGHDDLEIQ